MKTLNKIKSLKNATETQLEVLRENLKEEILKTLDAAYLEERIKDLEKCKDLAGQEDGLYQWARIDFARLTTLDLDDSEVKDALEAVLEDHDLIRCDFENDAIMRWLGPCLSEEAFDKQMGEFYVE